VEAQLADMMDRVQLTDADIDAVMRAVSSADSAPEPESSDAAAERGSPSKSSRVRGSVSSDRSRCGVGPDRADMDGPGAYRGEFGARSAPGGSGARDLRPR